MNVRMPILALLLAPLATSEPLDAQSPLRITEASVTATAPCPGGVSPHCFQLLNAPLPSGTALSVAGAGGDWFCGPTCSPGPSGNCHELVESRLDIAAGPQSVLFQLQAGAEGSVTGPALLRIRIQGPTDIRWPGGAVVFDERSIGNDCTPLGSPKGGVFPAECEFAIPLEVHASGFPVLASGPIEIANLTIFGCANFIVPGSTDAATESRSDPDGLADGHVTATAVPPSIQCLFECGQGISWCQSSAVADLEIDGNRIILAPQLEGDDCVSGGMTASAILDVDRPYLLTWHATGTCWPDFDWWKPLRIDPGVHAIEFGCFLQEWSFPSGSLSLTRIYPLDIHPDGTVDALDLAESLARWGACDPARTAADVNEDGSVDGTDISRVLTGWGTDGRGP